jgi:hypothetical protein
VERLFLGGFSVSAISETLSYLGVVATASLTEHSVKIVLAERHAFRLVCKEWPGRVGCSLREIRDPAPHRRAAPRCTRVTEASRND